MTFDPYRRHNVHISGHGSRPIVFAHGFGCDQQMWRFVAPAFEADRRVVLFDHIGCGKSDLQAYDPERHHQLQGYAEDVVALLDALDLHDVVYVGHSVSAMIGLLASIQRPERFARLVLLAPSPCYLNDPAEDYVGGFERTDLEALIDMMESNMVGFANFLAPVAMGSGGPATLAADGTLLRVNPALCALLGRAAESLVGQSFDVLLRAASRMLYQSYLMPMLRLHGQLQEFSLSLLVADGQPVDALLFANRRSNAQATAYDLLLVPLRQRRRLEDELLQVKRAADESPGMLFQLMCLPDGPSHFPYVREAVRRLYGCTPMAARDCAEAVFSQLLPEDRTTLVRALCAQPALDTAWHGRYQVRGPGGAIAWHEMSATPRRLASGATLWHGHVADVTAQRAMQAALAERQAAEQASHAKSDFLARVSHELRTPLNGILGFAQLLLTQQADNLRDEQRHRLAVVQRAGQGLLALINEVLDITSIEMGQLSLHPQPLPVAGLAQWALQAVEAQALDAGVSLPGPPAPAPDLVLADERRLQQVLLNLLSNAIKYNHRGGQVTLGVSVVGWPADLHGAGADALCLAVTDTGPGLSDEQQRHLFEPFNRLGAERGGTDGTGLGLAISQQLVGLMGGCIRVRSTPGQGRVFQVLLPRAAAALPLPPPEGGARSTGTPAPTRGRVLYVEDNPINVLLMEAIIDLRPGVRLQVAGNMAQGLAAALADPPDLLLLDMQLPDGDGATLLQALRGHPRLLAVPAVAVSAAARADDLLRAREVSFTAYWTKPVVVDDVLAGLDQLLAPGQA